MLGLTKFSQCYSLVLFRSRSSEVAMELIRKPVGIDDGDHCMRVRFEFFQEE
jgi:hypothetical protein